MNEIQPLLFCFAMQRMLGKTMRVRSKHLKSEQVSAFGPPYCPFCTQWSSNWCSLAINSATSAQSRELSPILYFTGRQLHTRICKAGEKESNCMILRWRGLTLLTYLALISVILLFKSLEQDLTYTFTALLLKNRLGFIERYWQREDPCDCPR